MVLETKGVDSQQNQTKREYLNEWIKSVNNYGGFGKWHWDVSFHPSDLESILKKYSKKQKMEATLIVALVRGGMQAISFWQNQKDRIKAINAIKDIDKISKQNDIIFENKSLLNIAPQSTIDLMTDRIKNCFDRYNQVLNDDDFLPAEIDKATNALIKCICREIERLVKINGKIPSKTLQEYRDLYNCNIK